MSEHVPATLFPTLRYADAPGAIEFLKKAFGMEEHLVVPGEVPGTVAHAQLRWGNGLVMLGSKTDGSDGRIPFDSGPQWIYLVTDDPDGLHERAVAAGAEIVEPPTDQEYGSREFCALDPGGNRWSFGTYQPLAEG